MDTVAWNNGIHLISAFFIPLWYGILWPMSHFAYDAEFRRQNVEACFNNGLFHIAFSAISFLDFNSISVDMKAFIMLVVYELRFPQSKI